MIGRLSEAGTAALFASLPVPGFTLWFWPNTRKSGNREPLATAPTERAALDHIGIGNSHKGRWLILPTGRHL